MEKKRIRYREGQWFAVPLLSAGYALGIVARGRYKTKIPLGYFFGPRYLEILGSDATLDKKHENAILVAWFGDLRIVDGSWPLISSTRSFSREEWPLPLFGRKSPLTPGKAFLVEYGENPDGRKLAVRESVVPESYIAALPEDGLKGADVIAYRLTELLNRETSSD